MSPLLHREAIRARVEVLASSGRKADALALLQEQAPHHLDEPWLHADLAQLYVSLERYAEGEQAARQSLSLDPEGREALLLLAIAQQELERLAEARDTAATAVALYPDDAVAHRIAAAVYVGSDDEADRKQGWAHIQRALELNPHDPEQYVVAVYANTAVSGPVALSRRFLEKGLSLDPGNRQLILASAALQESPAGIDPAALVSSLLAVNPQDREALDSLRGEFFRRLTSLAFIPWLQVLVFGFLATSLANQGNTAFVALVLVVLFGAVAFVQRLRHGHRYALGLDGVRIDDKRGMGGAAAALAALAGAGFASRWLMPDAAASAVLALVLAGVLLAVAGVRLLLHLRRFPPGYAVDLLRGNRRAGGGAAAAFAAFAAATAGTLWTAGDSSGAAGGFLLLAAVTMAAAAVHLLEGAERETVPKWRADGFEDYREWRIKIGLRPFWYLVVGIVLGFLPLPSDPLGTNPLTGVMAVAAGGFVLVRGIYTTALLLAAPDEHRGAGQRLAIRAEGAGTRVLIPGNVVVTAVLLVPLALVGLGAGMLFTGSGPSVWVDSVDLPQAPDFLRDGDTPEIPDVPGLTPEPAPTWRVPGPQDH
ncbi:hypothetical protein NNX39_06750 [Arthrobacter sp. zg-Y826]|uniref:hypothetical protein n=1 Tax=Arthrobacter jinronghuae TaxID=2964609 RepID=UPI00210421E0|nr:hypothetical protein [Arthrobacter jinronghuae]MCQ1956204.1 hypothetical protein [Arthrobacter jinronghuae]